MSNQPRAAAHPPGETTGTEERPAQRLAGAVLAFDLDREVARLRGERAWLAGDRNAKTLVKEADCTVVLIALRTGGRLAEHQAAGRVSLHCLVGRLRLLTAGEAIDLSPGRLVSLEHALPHTVEAPEDSAFLLTIGQQAPVRVAAEAPLSPDLPEGGRHGTTVGPLAPDGVVRVEGQLWSARAATGRIAPGRPVRVLAREGLTLVVTPAESGACAGERVFPDVEH
jgi:quercetin dioxygenase-like cupin family protein